MKKILVYIIFLLLIATNGLGASYYADCSIGGLGGSGTYAAPYRSIADVNDQSFSTSDDLYFKYGTTCNTSEEFELDWTGASGGDANRTYVGCYDGDGDFDCTGKTYPIIDVGNTANWAIDARQGGGVLSYVTIQQLHFKGGNASAHVIVDIDYGIIDDNIFTSDHQDGDGDKILFIRDCQQIQVSNNTIQYIPVGSNASVGVDGILLDNVENSKNSVAWTGPGLYKNQIYGCTHSGINTSGNINSDISIYANYVTSDYTNVGAHNRGYGRGISLNSGSGGAFWLFYNFFENTRTRNQTVAEESYWYRNIAKNTSWCCDTTGLDTDCDEDYADYTGTGSCNATLSNQPFSMSQSNESAVTALTAKFYHNTVLDSVGGCFIIYGNGNANAYNDTITAEFINNVCQDTLIDDTDSSTDDYDYEFIIHNWADPAASAEWTITAENNLHYPDDSDYRPPNDSVFYRPDNDEGTCYYQIPVSANDEWNTADTDGELDCSDDPWTNLTTASNKTVTSGIDADGEPDGSGDAVVNAGKTGLSITGAPTISGVSTLNWAIDVDCVDWDNFTSTVESCLIQQDASPDIGAFEYTATAGATILGVEVQTESN